MKILTYKDLILAYIRKDYADSEQKSLIEKIFYNENSVFLYSKKFVQFLENEIDRSENSREYPRFLAFVDKIQKEFQKKGNLKSAETSENFDEEFLHIFSTTQDKVVVSISCNQPSQEIQHTIPNIAILSQQRKPNYHWLVVNLAILHPNPILVRNYDFENDKEVDKFFFDIFSIPKHIGGVSIFDDACNFQHNKFLFLSKNKIAVWYYTVKFGITKSIEIFNNLKKKFSSVKMFGKPNGGHEREINFEGIIVIPTNDFWMLNITNGKKWSIFVSYSESEAKKSLDYKDKYDRFLENRWSTP